MSCASGKSKECTGVGHDLWEGMCSNCADVAAKESKRRES